MSYLNNTLNMLDDEKILDSTDTMELRAVSSENPDDISYPEEDCSLILVAIDTGAVTLHSFDDDMSQLGEILEALLATGYILSWKDSIDTLEFDSLEDLAEMLENTPDAPLYDLVLEALEELL